MPTYMHRVAESYNARELVDKCKRNGFVNIGDGNYDPGWDATESKERMKELGLVGKHYVIWRVPPGRHQLNDEGLVMANPDTVRRELFYTTDEDGTPKWILMEMTQWIPSLR